MKALKTALRRIQELREERFSRQRGIIRFGASRLIGFEPSIYKGPPVTLPSGAAIPTGARIVELHLDSRRSSEYLHDPPAKARIRLVRDSMASLRSAASWLQDDAAGKEIAAVHAVTLLRHQLERLGFEITALPAWPWIFMGIHMRYLAYLYGDGRGKSGQRSRGGFLGSIVPCEAWLTREGFLAKYYRPETTAST